MNETQLQLLIKYDSAEISRADLVSSFGPEIFDSVFVKDAMRSAMISENDEMLELCILLMWFQEDASEFIDELNTLLLLPSHRSHQAITKTIQEVANSSSIPFIAAVLESDFSQFDYTCSDEATITKWFSWALASIGTQPAIELIKRHSESSRAGISEEMQYRLRKIQKQND